MAHLFQHLIREANHAPLEWEGRIIERGQVVVGRKSLSLETGLTEQQIRTCIKRLKSTSEITSISTSKFSVITIDKYEQYQPQPNTEQPALQPALQPTINQQSTTNKNYRTIDDIYIPSQPLADDADAFVNSLSSSKPEPKVRTKRSSAPRAPRPTPVSIEDLPDEVVDKYSLAFPELNVMMEFNKCCNHQKANNRRIYDAQAAFHSWLMNARERSQKGDQCQR